MSWLGDAWKTIEAVVLLRSKVEQLNQELRATNDKVGQVIGAVLQVDRRLVRLETIEEMRSRAKPLPKIEG